MGKRGPVGNVIYSRVHRISLFKIDSDLLPFFQELDQLPSGHRNTALLAAIRGGQTAARQTLTRKESQRARHAIDALAGAFED